MILCDTLYHESKGFSSLPTTQLRNKALVCLLWKLNLVSRILGQIFYLTAVEKINVSEIRSGWEAWVQG